MRARAPAGRGGAHPGGLFRSGRVRMSGGTTKALIPVGTNAALAAWVVAAGVFQGWLLPALLRQFRGPIPLARVQRPVRASRG